MAGYVMHRLIPLADRRSPITVNGRTYDPASGVIDVPDFDSTVLQANGWSLLAIAGSETALAASPASTPGAKFLNEDSLQMIVWDGGAWREASGAFGAAIAFAPTQPPAGSHWAFVVDGSGQRVTDGANNNQPVVALVGN